uniref:Uncharacterized protein n=1 Tax=Romanomermis culicivorax TaxID=13658 RepID=A0A915JUJ0_ROMCU
MCRVLIGLFRPLKALCEQINGVVKDGASNKSDSPRKDLAISTAFVGESLKNLNSKFGDTSELTQQAINNGVFVASAEDRASEN